MAKRIFKYDKILKKMVEVTGAETHTNSGGLTIIPDIKPYVSMITGQMVTSRSEHKRLLKQYNKEEVGNEKPKFMRERE